MLKRKLLRQRGKISMREYFKTFKTGDRVALIRNLSFNADFPQRMQGKTGVIVEQRGRAYVVRINDLNMEKHFVVKPINMKKLESIQ